MAQGVQEHGLGNVPGMIVGMNLAQNMSQPVNPVTETKVIMTLDEQIEALKKMKELVDIGILTEDEFNLKKKEIMGL